MSSVKNYLSLIKFSHTIFAMPFAIIGFFIGIKHLQNIPHIKANFLLLTFPKKAQLYLTYNWHILLLVIVCMVTARAAAMAFNRYLDRSFDAKNPRTAIREIPKGIISANSALMFVIVNCLLFIIATFFINSICFYLSPIALFVILFYSYTKRFTALCHVILGIGLSLAPIGAYIAVTGVFNYLPILLSFAVIFWVAGFDIIFALQDVEFDKSQNLYSIPSKLGIPKALNVSATLHIGSAICILLAGYFGQFGWVFYIGAIFFCGMLLYQHSIVKPNDLSKVNIAFITPNGIASIVFSIFVIADLILQ